MTDPIPPCPPRIVNDGLSLQYPNTAYAVWWRDMAVRAMGYLDLACSEPFNCDGFHHAKRDTHWLGEDCPIGKRIDALREAIDRAASGGVATAKPIAARDSK